MLRPRESNDLPLQRGKYSDLFCRHLEQHTDSIFSSLLQASVGVGMQTLMVQLNLLLIFDLYINIVKT